MHVFLLLYYYYYDELRKTVSVTRNIYIPEPGDIIFYAYPSEPEYSGMLLYLHHIQGVPH